MSSASPAGDETGYKLTPRALDDLDDIWRYTAETWSVDQADSYIDELAGVFDAIVAVPHLAREYPEFSPPVRIHVYREHLIVYLTSADGIVIVRLLGGRGNWRAILNKAEF